MRSMKELFHRPVEGYQYRYEMHCHNNWCSACAHNAPQEIRPRPITAPGTPAWSSPTTSCWASSAVDRRLPWKEKMEATGPPIRPRRTGRQSRPGTLWSSSAWSTTTAPGKEVLTYGIGLDFLLAHPDLHLLPLEEYRRVVNQAGGPGGHGSTLPPRRLYRRHGAAPAGVPGRGGGL